MPEMGLGRSVAYTREGYVGTCPVCGERSVVWYVVNDYGGPAMDDLEVRCGCTLTEEQIDQAADDCSELEPTGPGHDEPWGE